MRFLTAREALKRMNRGDLPTRGGGYSSALHFNDGQRTSGPVGHKLIRAGLVVPPVGTCCDTPYTLPTTADETNPVNKGDR